MSTLQRSKELAQRLANQENKLYSVWRGGNGKFYVLEATRQPHVVATLVSQHEPTRRTSI